MTKSPILAAGMLATLTALPGATVSVSTHRQVPARPGPSRGALSTGMLALRNVTVITMASDVPMRSAMVLVRNGRIVAVGPAAAVPVDARVIGGSGKYLIPGLTDMHTHLFSDGGEVHDSAGPAEIGAMLANGITAARLMIGTPEQLALRGAVADGKIPGRSSGWQVHS